VTQVVPNWNNPVYLAGFEELLPAPGRRYDGDERLSVFEFFGYSDRRKPHCVSEQRPQRSGARA
jgi:hypothetical protein